MEEITIFRKSRIKFREKRILKLNKEVENKKHLQNEKKDICCYSIGSRKI